MAVSMKDVDPAFQSIGNKAGTEIWHIKNFHPVPVPKADHGKFFTGHAYIILQTQALRSGAFHYDIFYWLGKGTGQDDALTAASKAVELDAALGGRTVLSREEEGLETDKFLSYFKPCLIPIPSDSVPARGESTVRLFMCKGRHVVRVKEVPFTRSSLNHDHVFVLETPSTIFQFNGTNTDIHQQAKALDVVKYLKDTFHGKECKFAVIEDGKFLADAEYGEFWDLFGGFAPLIKKLDDGIICDAGVTAPILFCVHQGKVENVEAQALERELLSTSNCYILDCGTELFTWVGRDTVLEERKATLTAAEEIIATRSSYQGIPLVYTIEGFEPREFRSMFKSWPVSPAVSMSEHGRGKVAVLLKHKGFNVKGLLKGTAENGQSHSVDLGGKLQIWCIKESTKESLPLNDYGKFYTCNCYIILYSYSGDEREEHFIFSWFGKQTNMDACDAASQYASEIASSLQPSVAEVHIFKGKEPPHFLSLFSSIMILKGDESSTEIRLFEVKKSGPHNWQAIQVDLDAISLNSAGCFFLHVKDQIFTWYGKFSMVEEQEATEMMVKFYQPGASSKALKEGSESQLFWDSLGGRKVHPSHYEPKESSKDPRLFSCAFDKGELKVMEVFNFSQDSLLNDEIMILDCGSEIFIWVGQAVRPDLKSKAWMIGQKYVEEAVRYDGICVDVPIYRISEGGEPSLFKTNFSWDSSLIMPHLNVFQRKVLSLKGKPSPVSRTRRRASLDGGGRLTSFTSSPASDLNRAQFGRKPTLRSADTSPERVRPPPSLARGGGGAKPSFGSSKVSTLSSVFSSSKEAQIATPVMKLASVRTSTKKKELSPSAPASTAPSPRTPRAVASPRSPVIAALASVFEPYSEKRLDFAWPGMKPRSSEEKAYLEEEEAQKPSVAEGNDDEKPEALKTTPSSLETVQSIYPYERLKISSSNPISGIDSAKREAYLSNEEFEETFHMNMETFYKLPRWKQDKYKILADLF